MSYEANFLSETYRKKLRQLKNVPPNQRRTVAIKHSPFLSLPATCAVLTYAEVSGIGPVLVYVCSGLMLGATVAAIFPHLYLRVLAALLFDWASPIAPKK